MAEKKAAGKASEGFTAEERAAMKARAQELKAEARASKNRAEGERAALAGDRRDAGTAIGPWPRGSTQSSKPARRTSAEDLVRMPAYALDGKVVCFFQAADKFKARYATVGFSDTANLDKARCGQPPSR